MASLMRRYSSHVHQGNPVAPVQRAGAWEAPEASSTITEIARAAQVSFNDARNAFLAYLRAQLGDVTDRVVFPPEHAVQPEHGKDDEIDDEPWPIRL
jgi:hypothetical protein